MKNALRALAFLVMLLPGLAAAQCAFTFPVPANTVVGRLGIGPGPCQAIPFSTLSLPIIGNAFVQFTGPTTPVKTYTLPNASGTIAMLNQVQTWTGAQSLTDGTLILLGLTSGSSTIKAPATGGGTATLFPGSDTIAGKSLANGGTNNSLTANNGGILWSDASKLNLLPGTATANLPLLSGASGSPAWASISYVTSAASGGVACFASASALGSSVLLTANAIVMGAGVGQCPTPLGSLGTTTTVLHGNASGPPTFGAVNLSTDAGGTLQAAQEPAHTGDMTNTAGSLATTVLKTNGVAFTANATAAVGQLPGTATNDNASAGNVGEYGSANVTRATNLSIVSGTPKTCASTPSLPAGDYDITGSAGFSIGTSATQLIAGISTITNAVPGFDSNAMVELQASLSAGDQVLSLPVVRQSLASPATFFLVEQATVGGASTIYCTIRWRRVR